MRIALSGYYGCGNTGDEAVLAGILQSFAQRGGSANPSFVVLSADPLDTSGRHGVEAVDRMSWGAVRAAVRGSDLLLSGGGSLLQDTTSLRSLVYYLAVVRLGRRWGRPAMLYAQGIGPLRSPVARRLTRWVADAVQMVTVRDAESAQLLRDIGVRRPPVEVTADPAFALQPEAAEQAQARLAAAGVPPGVPCVGVAVRPWRSPAPAVESYRQMASGVAGATGSHIVLLPMQPPGDTELAWQIAAGLGSRATVLAEPLSPRAALSVVAQMAGLVAMRLHALIFAARCGVPMVALSYDPKVDSLMSSLGLGRFTVPVGCDAAERAADRLVEAMERPAPLREAVLARASQLSDLALRNVDCALSIVR